MKYIDKINRRLKELREKGYTGEEAIMELAISAGLENFNPHRAHESELKEIAKNIK